jgi:UDP-galactopyranose mutase
MYDILLVGAGMTSATICASLKHKYKILVVDIRDHIGGNCYDYESGGSMLHRYGPHLFHSPDEGVVEFLDQFTEWLPYTHKVSAELESGLRVPFPYSQETSKVLGKQLFEHEVIDMFFKPYSTKMWGVDWDKLSPVIKNRVPKNTNKTSDYFTGQFTGIPKLGYTEMIRRMFSGVDIILGAAPDAWQGIEAKKVIYCGRPDRIKLKSNLHIGSIQGNWLSYRSLDFKFVSEEWDSEAPVVNFCHLKVPYTRKTFLAKVLGGNSKIVTYETPKAALVGDLTPYYFYPSEENTSRHLKIRSILKEQFPNLILAGRLGTSSYLDIFQCVRLGIELAQSLS